MSSASNRVHANNYPEGAGVTNHHDSDERRERSGLIDMADLKQALAENNKALIEALNTMTGAILGMRNDISEMRNDISEMRKEFRVLGDKFDGTRNDIKNDLTESTQLIATMIHLSQPVKLQERRNDFLKGLQFLLTKSKGYYVYRILRPTSRKVKNMPYPSMKEFVTAMQKLDPDFVEGKVALDAEQEEVKDNSNLNNDKQEQQFKTRGLSLGFLKILVDLIATGDEDVVMEILFFHEEGKDGVVTLPFGDVSSIASILIRGNDLPNIFTVLDPSSSLLPKRMKKANFNGLAMYGQPGVGKSTFMNILLILCLDQGYVTRAKTWLTTSSDSSISFVISPSTNGVIETDKLEGVHVSLEDPREAHVAVVCSYHSPFLIISSSPNYTFVHSRERAMAVKYLPVSYPSLPQLALMIYHIRNDHYDEEEVTFDSIFDHANALHRAYGPCLRELVKLPIDHRDEPNLAPLISALMKKTKQTALLDLVLKPESQHGGKMERFVANAGLVLSDLHLNMPNKGVYIYNLFLGQPSRAIDDYGLPINMEYQFISGDVQRRIVNYYLDHAADQIALTYWKNIIEFDRRLFRSTCENYALKCLFNVMNKTIIFQPSGVLLNDKQTCNPFILGGPKSRNPSQYVLRSSLNVSFGRSDSLYTKVKSVGDKLVSIFRMLESHKYSKMCLAVPNSGTFETLDGIFLFVQEITPRSGQFMDGMVGIQATGSGSQEIDTSLLAALVDYVSFNLMNGRAPDEDLCLIVVGNTVSKENGHVNSWRRATSGHFDFWLVGFTPKDTLTFVSKIPKASSIDVSNNDKNDKGEDQNDSQQGVDANVASTGETRKSEAVAESNSSEKNVMSSNNSEAPDDADPEAEEKQAKGSMPYYLAKVPGDVINFAGSQITLAKLQVAVNRILEGDDEWEEVVLPILSEIQGELDAVKQAIASQKERKR